MADVKSEFNNSDISDANGQVSTVDDGGTVRLASDAKVTNAAGASAVNIQDGGNSITVDATALPLPTGAATSANQSTEISSLSSIDGKLTTTNASLSTIDAGIPAALGQGTMATSMGVAIASNQSAIPTTETVPLQSIKIKGNTTDALIGNIGDRLKVESVVNQTPGIALIYQIDHAENAGNENMNVNGSVTPVNFVMGPPVGEIWYLDSLSFLIIDGGSNQPTNYGALASLTNGCQLIFDIDGVEHVVNVFKANKDITLVFQGGGGAPSGSSWLESTDSYFGNLDLRSQVSLNGDDGDRIIFRVRDNLTGLEAHYLTGRFWKDL